ncbi:MAG: nucleoside triphosphate pyrophosphohydrolase [Dehalococcoidia bacterium]
MALTIVGLGPGAAGLLTVAALAQLKSAGTVYLRTSRHPVVDELPAGLKLIDFDDVYESGQDFAGVYEEIANRVAAAAGAGDVTYAVPGHPLFGEATVRRLLELVPDARIIDGVSYLEPVSSYLRLDPLELALQLADALDLPVLDPARPALVAQVYNQRAASELKLAALRWYPPEHEVVVLQDMSLPTARRREVQLAELDRSSNFDHLTCVYLPALSLEANTRTMGGLRDIVARLRAPDGCPWDREQTHQSLRSDLLEETYEVLAALDEGDPHQLAEELGDLLNQVFFHAQLAAEAGDFELEDVVEAIAAKLVRRHPHVFAGVEVSGTDEVLKNWEAIKRQEKGDKEEISTLDRVPLTLPALHQTSVVLERAGRSGFTWPGMEDVLEKLTEEVAELAEGRTDAEREDEFGDVLFNLVNAGRYLGVEAESALRGSLAKFRRRFAALESIAARDGLDFRQMSREELLAAWAAARRAADVPRPSAD